MKHLWSITILHPNFHPKLGHGNMIEQDYDGAARNSDLIFRLIDEHNAQSRVPYEYESDDFSDEIRIYCRRPGQPRRTLINLQYEGN